ncbi:MAG: hypothetical protein H6Q63_1162 [Firmicutes bacterium]|nr:hypothetical protein [Bacillota bacterium]
MNTTKAEKILNQINTNRSLLIEKYPDLGTKVAAIKRSAAEDLKQIVDQAVKTLKAKGCHVILAKDVKEAREQVNKILSGSKKVVMSKNPVFTEIELAPYLESQNIEIIRTDLGERLAPSKIDVHPWIASINTPINNAGQIQQIKEDVRQQASYTEYGITGVDAIIAANGTIGLLEAEGNVRFTSNLPYNHIVVAGLEKIVPTLEDALAVCRATSIYGLGKDMLNYISFISGPSRTADIEFTMVQGMHGPKEVYVVLVDNGRLEASARGDLDALMCLHCGGCLVNCQNYLKEGLERGYRYSGKWQRVLAKFMQNCSEPLEQVDSTECHSVCPLGIQG